jgi:N-succinyl-L-ornithine transcarbamylase
MNYISIQNIDSPQLGETSFKNKKRPLKNKKTGKNRTLGMLFSIQV